MTLDLRNDGPLTLESLMLSRELAGSPAECDVLLTAEQQLDVYIELQRKVRFSDTGMRYHGMTLRVA